MLKFGSLDLVTCIWILEF